MNIENIFLPHAISSLFNYVMKTPKIAGFMSDDFSYVSNNNMINIFK